MPSPQSAFDVSRVPSTMTVLLPIDPPQNCAEAARQMGLKCGDVLHSRSAYSNATHVAELLFMGDEATVWKVTDTHPSGFVSTTEIRWPVLIVGSQRRFHEWEKSNT